MTEPAHPTIDAARLRKELEYLTAHPHHWRQGTWIARTACGTIGCLAGNTVLNAGYRPAYDYGTSRYTVWVDDGGARRTVGAVAIELLGLTDAQARTLFEPTNSLFRLWWLASRYTGGEVTVPPDVHPTTVDRFEIGVASNGHPSPEEVP